jgi:hypothetical protein
MSTALARPDVRRRAAGVARALHLAGRALGDPELSAVAVDALRGVFRRPWPHAGAAGVALALATFARHPGTAGTAAWDSVLLLN